MQHGLLLSAVDTYPSTPTYNCRISRLLLCCWLNLWEMTAALWVIDQVPGVRSTFPACLHLVSLMIFQIKMVSVLLFFKNVYVRLQ
jgi:hypothetical protein